MAFPQFNFFAGSQAPDYLVGWFGSMFQDKAKPDGTAYRRARMYDYETGRFTQEDPIGLAGGVNVYGFAGGDPVNYDDPFGLKVCFVGKGAQSLAKAVMSGTQSQVSRSPRYFGAVALAAAAVVVAACAKRSSAADHQSLVEVLACDTVPKVHAGVRARVPLVKMPTTAGTLTGSIDEHLTDLAVGGASVRIRGDENRDTMSDSTGGFVVENLKPGRYDVVVIHLGYDPKRDSVLVPAGGVVTRRYHLRYRSCPL
jgi:RHS repeat-associated protein